MVLFVLFWRVVLRRGHPQSRWSVRLMTQHEGMPLQFPGDHEDFGALPRNAMESGKCRIKLPASARRHPVPTPLGLPSCSKHSSIILSSSCVAGADGATVLLPVVISM